MLLHISVANLQQFPDITKGYDYFYPNVIYIVLVDSIENYESKKHGKRFGRFRKTSYLCRRF